MMTRLLFLRLFVVGALLLTRIFSFFMVGLCNVAAAAGSFRATCQGDSRPCCEVLAWRWRGPCLTSRSACSIACEPTHPLRPESPSLIRHLTSQLLDGFFGLARGCQAGDIRVRHLVVVPTAVSVLALQGPGGSVEQYISKVIHCRAC
jgi:hypothetical protein